MLAVVKGNWIKEAPPSEEALRGVALQKGFAVSYPDYLSLPDAFMEALHSDHVRRGVKITGGAVLTPVQEAVFSDLVNFVSNRYALVTGSPAPELYGAALVLSPPDMSAKRHEGSSGYAHPRWIVAEGMEEFENYLLSQSLIVHEAVHAFGHVRIGPNKYFDNLLTDVRQNGIIIHQDTGDLRRPIISRFDVLNEAVATSEEYLFLRSKGVTFQVESLQTWPHLVSRRALTAAACFRYPELFDACIESYKSGQARQQQWAHECVVNDVSVIYEGYKATVPKTHKDGECRLNGGYALVLRGLEKLSPEMYPEMTQEEAIVALHHELALAQYSGKHAPLCKRIANAFGIKFLNYLSYLQPSRKGLDLSTFGELGIRLQYFADARKLPKEQCEQLRDILIDPIDVPKETGRFFKEL